jgi:hypothetical protein
MQIRCFFISVILAGRYDRKTPLTRRQKNVQKKHTLPHSTTPLGRLLNKGLAIHSGVQLYYKRFSRDIPFSVTFGWHFSRLQATYKLIFGVKFVFLTLTVIVKTSKTKQNFTEKAVKDEIKKLS